MKVLFILHLPPPIHGASMVGQFIIQSKVVKSAFQSRFINLGTSRTIDEIGKNQIQKVLRYISLLLNVLLQIIQFRPRMVYLTISSGGPGFFKDFPLAMLSGLLGARRVYHYHNKGIVKYQDRWLDDKLYKLVFRNTKVILLSEYLYSDIKKYVNESDVFYCPNGIPGLNPDHELSLSSMGKPDKTNISTGHKDNLVEILFLSNLIESKGIFVLLEACRQLKDRNVNFHLTMVGGEGDVSSTLLQQKIVDLGLTECVTYAGRQMGGEKELYFRRADIFVHPTFEDCQPLVILEAMQHALPIVSTFEGAIPGMVIDGENGFLVPKGDTHALAARLKDLIMNPDLRSKMGNAGHERFLRVYTLEAFEKRFVNILNDIISD